MKTAFRLEAARSARKAGDRTLAGIVFAGGAGNATVDADSAGTPRRGKWCIGAHWTRSTVAVCGISVFAKSAQFAGAVCDAAHRTAAAVVEHAVCVNSGHASEEAELLVK